MPHDHEPAISDLHDPLQQDMMVFLGDYNNIFDYPMSTPVVAQPNLWDHPLPMDLGVMAAPEQNHFQLPPSSTHRHSGSFDWNSETQLFQNVNTPPSNQENIQPTTMTGAPAPKLLMSDAVRGSNVDASMRIPSSLPSDDPFITGGDAVDPGLLCSRPQSAATDAGHGGAIRPGSAGVSALEADKAQGSKTRGPSGKKRTRKTTKGPERSSPCLPHKASKRPALGRSASDSRASRPRGRNLLPSLAPASNPAHGTGNAASAAASRLSGRTSPLRSQQRLSSLTRVPEKTPRFHPQASVELTVDAFGRAHAKTTLPRGGTLARSQSSQDMSRNRDWSMADADDSDDTDYEPIIIPSRQTSFTASFALRDPCEPVGSIFHSSGQDQAARSSSGSINGGESDAETVMAHERSGDNGDAASEIRKVMSYRRRGLLQQRDGRTQRFLSINPCNFPGGIISPTSLTDSSFGTDVCSVRCYCNNGSYDESEGCMVKWWVPARSRPCSFLPLFLGAG
ncbi:hypothetical protein AAL_04201 [Moelleriella libera RCEF 2490]|uniref:PHD finger domain protein n=1 Tax=Moelleriella libera RCEF 2490 TaxID=1081109 RepID=A0A168BYA3_9HYPO|nr:hypothetical protein AAL_04201 [Moelleriella libera RCEF 2490]